LVFKQPLTAELLVELIATFISTIIFSVISSYAAGSMVPDLSVMLFVFYLFGSSFRMCGWIHMHVHQTLLGFQQNGCNCMVDITWSFSFSVGLCISSSIF
jgi:hypothetical protein